MDINKIFSEIIRILIIIILLLLLAMSGHMKAEASVGDNGGWINSPAGAYMADESLSGKATFGVVARNQKAASVPTGNTAFKFDLAGLDFTSQSYDWLVVNHAGTHAQFKGSGWVNGMPDANGNAYKFMLWAKDGSSSGRADTFRIRIWWEDAAGVHDVYDNGAAQPTGPGYIVVHKSE